VNPVGPEAGWDADAALGRALLSQDDVAVTLHDMELHVLRSNAAFDALRPQNAEGDGWFLSLPAAAGTETAGDRLRNAAHTGVPVIGSLHHLPADEDRALSLSCFPLRDPQGTPAGVAAVTTEAGDRRRGRSGSGMLYRGAVGIGGSLDVVNSARELADALVPVLGDLASVDMSEEVLQGHEPTPGWRSPERNPARRVAAKHAHGAWPVALVQVGEVLPPIPDRPEFAAAAVGQESIASDAARVHRLLGGDPELVARMMPEGMRCSLGCPLYDRGVLLGYVLVWRTRNPTPFDDEDVQILQMLCGRTAQAVRNALSFTREHATAVVLQHSLLPPAATESAAAETAGTYLPTGGATSVGGDWFDALPLSSLRIGLVVGDVIGHGLQATATMARLRTAVQTLADLDLGPDELLARLDDLVQRMAAEAEDPDAVGASCLFAVYDPVSGDCRLASAGHPPPALVLPDGRAEYLDVVPGPPLGVGDNPFEVFSADLPPGSVLALYTDGLVTRDRDPDGGGRQLLSDLAAQCSSGRTLSRAGADLVDLHHPDGHPSDDVTLLLARTRAVPPQDTAAWEYRADPAAVQEARSAAVAQLLEWGLDDLTFATELVVSELVTNAVRHAGGPITLRLIRDRVLLCEVTDPSSTQPRLRRAQSTDEGGRGLFLVAQLTTRWGSRYGPTGKTIWTEQVLTAP
jgi:serine phosphatase RsbU (regulator of sigma subunit)/anti-sigma regulatory factor (Ser/Thr protein kinase)